MATNLYVMQQWGKYYLNQVGTPSKNFPMQKDFGLLLQYFKLKIGIEHKVELTDKGEIHGGVELINGDGHGMKKINDSKFQALIQYHETIQSEQVAQIKIGRLEEALAKSDSQ